MKKATLYAVLFATFVWCGSGSVLFSVDAAEAVTRSSENSMFAQAMPRRKPGSEEPGGKDSVAPKPKPVEEAEPEEEKTPPPPPRDEEAEREKREAEKEQSAWEGDGSEAVKSTQTPSWYQAGLVVLASAIFSAAAFLSFWVLKWRSFAVLFFVTTAWFFEFYTLGFKLSPDLLSFFSQPLVPIALLGFGGAVMLDAAVGPHLPVLYRRILGFGFGGYFAALVALGATMTGLSPMLAKAAIAVAVPLVLYAQVLTWGRGIGRGFTFGLAMLCLSVIAVATAPLFVNTGPDAAFPLWLHLMFLAGLALITVPAKVTTEFAEDFHHTGVFEDDSFGETGGFAGFGSQSDRDDGFDKSEPRFSSPGFDDDHDDRFAEDERWDDEEWEEDHWDDHGSEEDEVSYEEERGNEPNDYEAIAAAGSLFDKTRKATPPPPPPARGRRAPPPRHVDDTLEDENRYALGIAGAHQGLWDWTIDRDELYLSPSVDGMLGLPNGAAKRSEVGWAERVHPDDFHAYRDALRTYISRGNAAFDMEFRVRHENGEYLWMKLRATCLPDETGVAARVVGTVADITLSRNTVDRLSATSETDPLTGLANRIALTSHLDGILGRTHDPEALPSLVVIDLDRFKTVNDSLGQASGDALLQTVARRLEDVTGRSGLVSRLGSDEFAILVYKERGMRPGVIAAKALDALAQPVELEGHEVFPMASLGLAEAGPQHRRAEDLLKDAETAMFRAKRQGGGCVEIYEASMTHQTVEALSIETDLRRALERQQMEVMFQPIMDFRTDSVSGFEALLRWRHPTHGLMTPDQFVSIAEANDMIVPLGRFVLSMASLQLSQWQKLFPVSPPLFVSVNVSSRQLKRVDFADDVREVLETADILPGTLKLEVTESLIQEDPILAENLLREVRGLGAGIVLDDFGTGFASLANLQRYPFDTIKVDRSFVSTMDSRADSHVIVNSIVTLAGDLGLTVIAEGLESENDRHRLYQMGCDYGQGFIFGPPMNPLDAQTFIAHHWSVD